MRYLILLLLVCAQVAAAQPLTVRVTGIKAGDTLAVVDDQRRQLVVRLAGIDAPARTQDFGAEAMSSLAALVFNREVVIVGARPDSQGRVVAKVMAADPNCNSPACPKIHNVGLLQVMAGMAWWDRRHAATQTPQEREDYAVAEFNAKLRRAGLWTGTNPVPPWEWPAR